MIKHKQQKRNKQRYEVLKNTHKLIDIDGLSSVSYKLKKIKLFTLFTYLLIDVGVPE
jgi:hypothetical protein